jgi:hypothetical protein
LRVRRHHEQDANIQDLVKISENPEWPGLGIKWCLETAIEVALQGMKAEWNGLVKSKIKDWVQFA